MRRRSSLYPQVHDVLGVVELVIPGQRSADRDQHQPHAGVGPLVDVEVVVGGQRVHPQAQVKRLLQLVASLAGLDTLEGLRLGRLQVVGDSLQLGRVVVVGLQVATDRLNDRGRVLRQVRNENSWAHIDLKPNIFW